VGGRGRRGRHLAGITFGESCEILSPIGFIYVGLLQAAVILTSSAHYCNAWLSRTRQRPGASSRTAGSSTWRVGGHLRLPRGAAQAIPPVEPAVIGDAPRPPEHVRSRPCLERRPDSHVEMQNITTAGRDLCSSRSAEEASQAAPPASSIALGRARASPMTAGSTAGSPAPAPRGSEGDHPRRHVEEPAALRQGLAGAREPGRAVVSNE